MTVAQVWPRLPGTEASLCTHSVSLALTSCLLLRLVQRQCQGYSACRVRSSLCCGKTPPCAKRVSLTLSSVGFRAII